MKYVQWGRKILGKRLYLFLFLFSVSLLFSSRYVNLNADYFMDSQFLSATRHLATEDLSSINYPIVLTGGSIYDENAHVYDHFPDVQFLIGSLF